MTGHGPVTGTDPLAALDLYPPGVYIISADTPQGYIGMNSEVTHGR